MHAGQNALGFARGDEVANKIALIRAVGDVVIVILAVPQAETGFMLGGQYGEDRY